MPVSLHLPERYERQERSERKDLSDPTPTKISLRLSSLVQHDLLSTPFTSLAMVRDLARSLQRTLVHLKPPPVKGGQHGSPIPTHFRTGIQFVQVKDRIPFWNIAPEDKVKLVKGRMETRGYGTVDSVDRERNVVYLKENVFNVRPPSPPPPPLLLDRQQDKEEALDGARKGRERKKKRLIKDRWNVDRGKKDNPINTLTKPSPQTLPLLVLSILPKLTTIQLSV